MSSQLLAVMPPDSAHALPHACANLMRTAAAENAAASSAQLMMEEFPPPALLPLDDGPTSTTIAVTEEKEDAAARQRCREDELKEARREPFVCVGIRLAVKLCARRQRLAGARAAGRRAH